LSRVFEVQEMQILGIETSCDETASAVMDESGELLANVVSSQVEVHRPFGGVVPEIASRKHMENILPVIRKSMKAAAVTIDDIGAVAVTQGPGLVGSLLVGLGVAKALAYGRGIPLVGVNHLAAHIAAVYIEHPQVTPPFVSLVVSGGHTALYHVLEEERFQSLGHTRDDAAGEAFDKVAKLLGLGYPGGPIIDEVARQGDPGAIPFPRGLSRRSNLEFSFSGLKTAVLLHLRGKCLPPLSHAALADLAASFQEAVIDVLVAKTRQAALRCRVGRCVVTGGVACNRRLRERMLAMGAQDGIEVFFPSATFCTDNAAMVARAGIPSLRNGRSSVDLGMNARSRWPLG
jgi:N6-L-threonylcarbamoyladenine synthase